ncbi:GerAB/ArcD/ProY family transporter [Paenibacillus glycanilyticus]|uniref:Germination protein n=1 Tax=Paenibacillus glycanilyticus TaxID=126569 RepID=A0ABQ6NKL5_9BACL|nr:endospore germination permease [Paenibacillus glycanilyticus]GMK45324.1 germination protein [Paenibacillus glycanilyticus]
MQRIEKISNRQLMVLVFLYTVGSTILIIPSGLAEIAKQDAWIGALAGVVIGGGTVVLYILLWRLFPGKTFVGICEAVFGKWIGALISVMFMFYSFIGSTTVMFYSGNFFKINFLPHTPFPLINILIATVVVVGVRMGLETIARTSELMLPWVLILLAVLVFTLLQEINLEYMLPVFEVGWKSVFWAGFSFAGTAFMPIVFLFAVFPSVLNADKARTGMYFAAILGGGCVVVITLLCILILGPNITSRSMFPSYALVKKISIGNFFQRVEVIMAGLWFVTTYIKTTFYFYGWVSSLAEILKLNNYRSLTLPCGILMIVFSFVVYPDVVYMQYWDSTIFPPYILTMGILVPLILWMVGVSKQKLSLESKNKP